MTYGAYDIEIEEGGEFDVQFTSYARFNPHRTARLITRFEAFAKKRKSNGDFIRGSETLSIYVVPVIDDLDGYGEAGLLALVDDVAGKIRPLYFLASGSRRGRHVYECLAEAILGI